MKIYLNILGEQEDRSYGLITNKIFTTMKDMLEFIVATYTNIQDLVRGEVAEDFSVTYDVYISKVV